VRIGILGGTFNPIHLGHLILAEEAREKLKLDKVIFVPANLAPHKDSLDIAFAFSRLEMVKLAVAGNNFFSCSDSEIKREGKSFTIDTLKEFKKKYPRDDLYFIIGSDLLKYLDDWKDLSKIIKMVKFVAATRPGYPLKKLPTYISTLPIRAVDISAFEIRSRIKEGKSFCYLVPAAVYRYIVSKKLYR